MMVYVIEGWFGSDEWIESIWLDETEAAAEVGRLSQTRRSERFPNTAYNYPDKESGLCKFGYDEFEVK